MPHLYIHATLYSMHRLVVPSGNEKLERILYRWRFLFLKVLSQCWAKRMCIIAKRNNLPWKQPFFELQNDENWESKQQCIPNLSIGSDSYFQFQFFSLQRRSWHEDHSFNWLVRKNLCRLWCLTCTSLRHPNLNWTIYVTGPWWIRILSAAHKLVHWQLIGHPYYDGLSPNVIKSCSTNFFQGQRGPEWELNAWNSCLSSRIFFCYSLYPCLYWY